MATEPTTTDLTTDESQFIRDIQRSLGRRPYRLAPKWLYDERGSQLFDAITRLEEYYPTEVERSILREAADDIAKSSQATTLVELGSGTSDKTRTLLDALHATGQLQRFVPFDVSEEIMAIAASQISTAYEGIEVTPVVGDFTLHLAELPRAGKRMIAFLGSTIGNFFLEERKAFLWVLADQLEPGESVLLGVDLLKDLDRLIDAYYDDQGLTEQFIKNSLLVLNRRLDGDFDPEAFSYIPFWDPTLSRVDMRLRSNTDQRIRLPQADLELLLNAGEEIAVEISTKFRLSGITAELEHAGLAVTRVYTDPNHDFALLLASR